MVEVLGEYRNPRKVVFGERVEDTEGLGGFRLKVYNYSYFKSRAALVKAFNEVVPDGRKIK